MSFFDPYAYESPKLENSASNLYPITPDDSHDIPIGVKALRIWNPNAAIATIHVVTIAGDTVSFPVPPSSLWNEPLRIRRLLTSTTAGVAIMGYTDRSVALNEAPFDLNAAGS